MLFTAWWLDIRHPWAGALAGAAFGLAALARIDALFLVLPLVIGLLIVERSAGTSSRALAPFAVTLALLTAQSVVHAATVSQLYTLRLFGHLAHDRHVASIEGAALLAGLAIVGLVAGRLRGWQVAPVVRHHAGVVLVVAVIVWLAARLGPAIAANHRGVLDHLDLALDFSAGRSAVAAGRTDRSGQTLRTLVDRALDRRRPVVFVTSVPDAGLAVPELAGVTFTKVGQTAWYVDAGSHGAWPSPAAAVRSDLAAYRLAVASAPLPWHVDVGASDFGAILDGWQPPEVLTGVVGRWAGQRSRIALPRFECSPDTPGLRGTVRFASLRPSSLPQPRVVLAVADEAVLTIVPPDSEFHVYAFGLSAVLARTVCSSPALMSLSTDVFVPRRDLGLPDDRALGVAVSSIEIGTTTQKTAHE